MATTIMGLHRFRLSTVHTKDTLHTLIITIQDQHHAVTVDDDPNNYHVMGLLIIV